MILMAWWPWARCGPWNKPWGWSGGSAPDTKPPGLPAGRSTHLHARRGKYRIRDPRGAPTLDQGPQSPAIGPPSPHTGLRDAFGPWRRWPRPSAAGAVPGGHRRPPGYAGGPWYGEPRRNGRWPQVAPPSGHERLRRGRRPHGRPLLKAARSDWPGPMAMAGNMILPGAGEV